MLKRKQLVLMISMHIVGLSVGQAQQLPADHHCVKPEKPKVFQSLKSVADFNAAHENYKSCILEYINKHKSASQQHYQAASSAIKEWNHYVQEQSESNGS